MWWCFFNPHLLDYINDNIFNIYLLLNFDYISEIYLLFLFIKIDLLYLLNFKIRSAQKRSLESSVPDQRLIFDESRQECKYTTKQSAYRLQNYLTHSLITSLIYPLNKIILDAFAHITMFLSPTIK